MAPTARAALQAAADAPLIAEVVRRRRTQLTDQTRKHFAPELDALPAGDAADLLAAVDVLCQFEALEALRVERDLSPARTRQVLVPGAASAAQATVCLARPVARSGCSTVLPSVCSDSMSVTTCDRPVAGA